MLENARFQIKGIVQGVGFRPFVYRMATKYKLNGWVINNSDGVTLEIEGEKDNIQKFMDDVRENHPILARVNEIILLNKSESVGKYSTFKILESRKNENRKALISPDTYVCDDCIEELFDPDNRRYKYPFINCTNCGPRYTIIKDIPYDRAYTTMEEFKMCGRCDQEHRDVANRRFHAQPNACWTCGPTLSLYKSNKEKIETSDPIEKVIELLKNGCIIAVKGLGGYHLMADSSNYYAVQELRKRKARDEKPFALMVEDIREAKKLAFVSEKEEKILSSKERPILLLKKKHNSIIQDNVAPNNKYYGVMLAYTPTHYLILRNNFKTIVATSANISDEPIVFKDEEIFNKLSAIADYFLVNNREIYIRADDSILRETKLNKNDSVMTYVRRARGYTPNPIEFRKDISCILALGAELKNTICITKGNKLFLSQHIGDLKNIETYNSFKHTIEHFKKIFDIIPEMIACDLHPNFFSTIYAREQNKLPIFSVQHHHAHMASCMCENNIDEQVIGVIFDGIGYGTDGNLWGGEFLVGDYSQFERVAHLDYFLLPGGDKAVKEPYRIALGFLRSIFGEKLTELELDIVKNRNKCDLDLLIKMISKEINSPKTSSMGRLFDAVAALIGIKEVIKYEGQAAIELEQIMEIGNEKPFSYEIKIIEGKKVINFHQLFKEIIVHLLQKDLSKGMISYKFHLTIVKMITDICIELRKEKEINKVVFSGGVFLNQFLTTNGYKSLIQEGFQVYLQKNVPTNDGGISLGQAMIAEYKKTNFKKTKIT